jgi:hypothetical protein
MTRTREENAADLAHEEASKRETITVRIDCEVHDADALFAAALAHGIREDGMTKQEATELLRPDGEIDTAACLQVLLDPGAMLDAGFSILESHTE